MKFIYRCPMCGWKGEEKDASYYAMDYENLLACPVCVNDYDHQVLDDFSSLWCHGLIWRDRADLSWDLRIIEVVDE